MRAGAGSFASAISRPANKPLLGTINAGPGITLQGARRDVIHMLLRMQFGIDASPLAIDPAAGHSRAGNTDDPQDQWRHRILLTGRPRKARPTCRAGWEPVSRKDMRSQRATVRSVPSVRALPVPKQ